MTLLPPSSLLSPGSRCDLEKWIATKSIVAAWARQGIDVSDDFAGVDAIGLWRCQESQLQFYSPAPVGTERLYEFIARRAWYYARKKWEFGKAAKLLNECGCDAVLEVGCGSGEFLQVARECGLRADGIDLNSSAVAKARSVGLAATTDSMADVYAKGKRYNAVCAFQVLEHVGNPLEFVGEALKLVGPGGCLIFGTPDGDGWLGDRLQLLDMPPHHVSRWGRAAFTFLTRLFPLELMCLVNEPLEATHHVAWAAAIVDPDNAAGGGEVQFSRRLSLRQRLVVSAMSLLRSRAAATAQSGGQSLLAMYRLRPSGESSA